MRALLIAVALLCLAAPAVGAESRLITTDVRTTDVWMNPTLVAGPRFVGDEVLWAEQRFGPGEIAVVADGPAGRRTVDGVPSRPARLFAFDAAEGRVALTSFREECPPPGCDRSGTVLPVDTTLRAGPVAGPLADVSAGCAPLVPVIVAAAVGATCFATDFHVREDDGTVRTVAGTQTRFEAQLAGPYLARAVVEGVDATGVVVEDRRTGREILRINSPLLRFDLAPDGGLVLALPDRRVGLASPAAPALRTIAVPFEPADVRLAGDRVAIRHAGRAARFAVLDTGGNLVGEHVAVAAFEEWAFDGRRVAWLQRPCSVVTLAVWEVGGPPPPSAGVRCGSATVRSGGVAVSRGRRLAIPLRCPTRATAGCAGALSFTLVGTTPRGRRVRRAYPVGFYDLDAGANGSYRERLRTTDVGRFRRLRDVRVDIDLRPLHDRDDALVRRAIRL